MMSHAGNRDLKLFDFEASVHIGCPPLQKAANGSSDASGDSSTAAIDALIYKTNQKHDCAQTLKVTTALVS